MKKRIVVFASGTKSDGGTGFEKLHAYGCCTGSRYEVAAVVSHHERGGVFGRAIRLEVPFEHMSPPYDAASYRAILAKYDAEWAILSGWYKFVVGLDPARTVSIHPALLSFQNGRFGGVGMYRSRVHEAVAAALAAGELGPNPKSGFTMHFVTDGGGDKAKAYDKGPVIGEVSIPLVSGMTPKEISSAVRKAEHMWQPMKTDMVVGGLIRLEGDKVITPATPRFRSRLGPSSDGQLELPFGARWLPSP